ncbi:MAG TPA: hypothetical protein VIH71_11030 [Solirubrobacteraceae bacterium]
MTTHEHTAGGAAVAQPLSRKSDAEVKAIFSLRRELARLHGKATREAAAIAAMRHDIETLEAGITVVEEQIELAEEHLSGTGTLRLQLRRLETRCARLQAKIAQLEVKLARRQARIGRTEEALAALEVPRRDRLVTTLVGTGRHYQRGAKIVVTEGASVNASVRLRGGLPGVAEGTIEYDVYSDDACTKLLTTGGVFVVSHGGIPRSSPLTLPAGKYYWQSSYSGDKLNAPSKSPCGEVVETVLP